MADETEKKDETDEGVNCINRQRQCLAEVLLSDIANVTIVVLAILQLFLISSGIIIDIRVLLDKQEYLERLFNNDTILKNCNFSKADVDKYSNMYHDYLGPPSQPPSYAGLDWNHSKFLPPADFVNFTKVVAKHYHRCPDNRLTTGEDVTKCYQRAFISKGKKGRGMSVDTLQCNVITDVPEEVKQELNLSSFYKKYTHAYGIPVLSSEKVRNQALMRACYVVGTLLADRKDIRDAFYNNRGRAAVIDDKEKTNQIPEHRFLDEWWNWRARGLGATLDTPISTCGEENILCWDSDLWSEEDIFIHEFSHGIHLVGANSAIPDYNDRLWKAYKRAKSVGLWNNTYAISNHIEYFAEAVQSYFNVNKEVQPADGIHNHVNTREELKMYDPLLYDLMVEVFPCGNQIIDRCSYKNGQPRYDVSISILFYWSSFVLVLFVSEVLLKTFALCKTLLEHKGEIFDIVLVVFCTFIVTLTSKGFSRISVSSRYAFTILVVRLWRVRLIFEAMTRKKPQEKK